MRIDKEKCVLGVAMHHALNGASRQTHWTWALLIFRSSQICNILGFAWLYG